MRQNQPLPFQTRLQLAVSPLPLPLRGVHRLAEWETGKEKREKLSFFFISFSSISLFSHKHYYFLLTCLSSSTFPTLPLFHRATATATVWPFLHLHMHTGKQSSLLEMPHPYHPFSFSATTQHRWGEKKTPPHHGTCN